MYNKERTSDISLGLELDGENKLIPELYSQNVPVSNINNKGQLSTHIFSNLQDFL